ncbi:MAG: hypothetical protein KDB27_22955 [Planctomycetales bacterium]|nr:hypothetical protein [Planctomycetales bacterium]
MSFKTLAYYFVAAAMATVVFLTGCAETSGVTPETGDVQTGAETALANTLCPVLGNPVTKDGGRVEWNGQMIGFCCPKCIEKWNALSNESKAASLSDLPSANSDSPHDSDHH